LQRHIPTIRDTDNQTYFKEEVGGLIVGFYEPNPIPFRDYPIPGDHEFKLMPENVSQVEPFLDRAYHRFPALETVGVKRWFNGIEAFTEDGMFIVGEAPEVARFFVATGFNAFGIASAGGAGLAIAHWVIEGAPPFDLWPVDIRRFGGFHRSRKQVMVRSQEGQSRHFAMHWPHFEATAGRPLRMSPLYSYLKAGGACFGSKFGWERANWFAPTGIEPVDRCTFDRPNWFRHVAEEHRACREAVAVFDLSSFAKFLLVGRDAEAALQRICAANVATPNNVVTYTQLLNDRGGIEADLTVTRLAEDRYLIITGTGYATRDAHHIQRSLFADGHVHLVDVTSGYGCLSLMGPKAPDLLQIIAEGDIDDTSFPFGAARALFVDGAPVLALRVSFVGERGWELFVPSEYLPRVYQAIKKAGEPYGLKDAGYRAIDSLRLEKARRVWGSDIGPDYTPLEAGLAFAVDLCKSDFTGRNALVAQRKAGRLMQRLAVFTVDDPETTLYGRETIFRDGKRVGWLTSGGYGHTIGRPIGLGYVRNAAGVDNAFLSDGRYELEVRTRRVGAKLHMRPPYDPDNRRVR
jgi:4-methylaminobutanoate oxidase (formaldehyde-forming)